ncbi:uncharacterized protein LOC133520041 [Cydia pomonella]|uniref:uncharacterized protein LOC133520041 n=1 Tax=Cydia pomonella TaxID=82600 RepID=UPI002ADD7C8C|nr:uncharacterized protein LOC133520041 [Cydia pomonella]
MGLHQLVNYFLIVHVSQAVLNCFAFDFGDRHVRRSPFPGLRDIQHSYSNTYSNTSHQPFYWKLKNENSQNDYKESNFLWRNAKTVTNIKTSTAQSKRRSYMSVLPRHTCLSTTASYIEFDYLDEDQYQKNTSLKRLHRVDTNIRGAILDQFKTRLRSTLRSPSNSLRINDPYNAQELLPISKPPKILQESALFSHHQAFNKFKIKKVDKLKNNIEVSDLISNEAYLGRKLATVKVSLKDSQMPTTTVKLLVQSTTSASTTVFTSPDDRVKFFEIYDTNTLRPSNKRLKLNSSSMHQSQKMPEIISITENFTNKSNGESNIPSKFWRLDNPINARFERKYKNFRKRSFKVDGNLDILNGIPESNASELHAIPKTYSHEQTFVFSKTEPLTRTAMAKWSSYPFASVYVYKPTQTHCDASGISPHWLLAAGSCLSRHNLEYSIDERSAYVTYCGEHWRSPERIAYVKRIVVHPKFNPRDKVRRLLFNIGLIQVSNSMSTSCPRWAPIAMMSHQFSASSAGTMASAVGWGLDRYGSKYTTEKLPHWPLTVYEALVYHNTCPGSSTFSMAKRQDGSGASNVYCLLLPVYTGEENDSVHGGLLLVDGKLIALYLQEERRAWGSQSAQYTGVWRLLPWITDVAYEHDDAEITLDV